MSDAALSPSDLPTVPSGRPLIIAVAMGFGHLRAAQALADAWSVPVFEADRVPLATATEIQLWQTTRERYERLSRWAAKPWSWGAHGLLRWLTHVADEDAPGDFTQPTFAWRYLNRLLERGLGNTLGAFAEHHQAPVVTTFHAIAHMAERFSRVPVYCLVTDADAHRIWAPLFGERSRIVYLAPCDDVRVRLLQYGVSARRIQVTGFPLPDALVGGVGQLASRMALVRRLGRLDPAHAFMSTYEEEVKALLGPLSSVTGPLHMTLALGGAGAQLRIVEEILEGVAPIISAGELRLTIMVGTSAERRDHLAQVAARVGLASSLGHALQLAYTPTLTDYFAAFNRIAAETDLLWTKPSELVFYAALGLPLILAPPLGVHEERNRRFVQSVGAALEQPEPKAFGWWLRARLADGSLARAAFWGYTKMNRNGLPNILRAVEHVATS